MSKRRGSDHDRRRHDSRAHGSDHGCGSGRRHVSTLILEGEGRYVLVAGIIRPESTRSNEMIEGSKQ